MSTQLKRVSGGYEVSTVIGPGSRKKAARKPVFVPAGDLPALKDEIVRQAKAARLELGVPPQKEKPLV